MSNKTLDEVLAGLPEESKALIDRGWAEELWEDSGQREDFEYWINWLKNSKARNKPRASLDSDKQFLAESLGASASFTVTGGVGLHEAMHYGLTALTGGKVTGVYATSLGVYLKSAPSSLGAGLLATLGPHYLLSVAGFRLLRGAKNVALRAGLAIGLLGQTAAEYMPIEAATNAAFKTDTYTAVSLLLNLPEDSLLLTGAKLGLTSAILLGAYATANIDILCKRAKNRFKNKP